MSGVISPVTGTRSEPIDSYVFVRGTTATFKTIFMNNGIPTTVDTLSIPYAQVITPLFLSTTGGPSPQVVATIPGSLVPGQQFEYQFVWAIPAGQHPIDEYVIRYKGVLGTVEYDFGDEFFTIGVSAGMIGLKRPSYATVDDLRKKKFNIDDYLPKTMAKDLNARNSLMESHLVDAATRLREEVALYAQKGNTENYRMFCIFYSIWTIMLASRGEDGSSVSDQNLMFWRTEWERILSQVKRKSGFQGIGLGRG